MSTDPSARASGFGALSLPDFLVHNLAEVGYESPTPIQQATIPHLLSGRDITGMAQTGTGKTAAFALPILAGLDTSSTRTQALILCPTRELAIQVAEAFRTYARGMRGFSALALYGGQEMGRQLQALRRGAQVVVATPGRLLDHLRRRTLGLGSVRTVVLDEADEMLRMGFIDDVEDILRQVPEQRQVALFSATMPPAIRKVANRHLRNPEEIRLESQASTNDDIEQRYWLVQGTNKLDALTRLLEVEDSDGVIVFVRTRNATVELAEQLNARGFSAAALNGDMNQSIRQRTVEQLRAGRIDILVATDVAARGLDVERISHVMNYDIPHDNEAYVHRIGRTGRAGRKGRAILFVAPREKRLLQSIEKTTGRSIGKLELPGREELEKRRNARFAATVRQVLEEKDLSTFRTQIDALCRKLECPPEEIAAAMASLLQGEREVRSAPRQPEVLAEPRRPAADHKPKRGRLRKTRERQALDRRQARAARPASKGRTDRNKGKRRKPTAARGGQSASGRP